MLIYIIYHNLSICVVTLHFFLTVPAYRPVPTSHIGQDGGIHVRQSREAAACGAWRCSERPTYGAIAVVKIPWDLKENPLEWADHDDHSVIFNHFERFSELCWNMSRNEGLRLHPAPPWLSRERVCAPVGCGVNCWSGSWDCLTAWEWYETLTPRFGAGLQLQHDAFWVISRWMARWHIAFLLLSTQES